MELNDDSCDSVTCSKKGMSRCKVCYVSYCREHSGYLYWDKCKLVQIDLSPICKHCLQSVYDVVWKR